MKLHANAPFGPKGRLTMVSRVTAQEWSLTQATEAAGVSERTAGKWVGRYRDEGEALNRGAAIAGCICRPSLRSGYRQRSQVR